MSYEIINWNYRPNIEDERMRLESPVRRLRKKRKGKVVLRVIKYT